MAIYFNKKDKLFVLETASSTYALMISSDGHLLSCWWGARIFGSGGDPTCEDLAAGRELVNLPEQIWGGDWKSYLEPRYREEFPAWHGHYFNEPGVKINDLINDRSVIPLYKNYRISDLGSNIDCKLEVELFDKKNGLSILLIYNLYPALDVIERRAVITNTGKTPLQLENVKSAVWYLPRGEKYRIRHYYGKWSGEYQIAEIPVEQNKICLESRRGVSGHDSNPWFSVHEEGQTLEETGPVWAGIIHWSGNWKIAIEKDRLDQVIITGGIHEFDFSFELTAGESFETPVFSSVYTEEGFGGASRRLHSYINEKIYPRIIPKDKKAIKSYYPVLYNSWDAFHFDFKPEKQLELAGIAAETGVELYIIDDAWFSSRDNNRSGLGDWHPSRKKFPEGLEPFIDKINKLGMDFGLWVEPEMVNPDSELYRKHPNWVIGFPGRPLVQKRNQLVLNLAKKEVKDYIVSFMSKILERYNIRYIKWDMNRYIYDPGWPDVPVNRQKEIWYSYVKNLYSIFSTLRNEFPDVLFENCASGGGREDLGMRYFTEFANISDNCDAFDRLRIIEGYSHAYPIHSASLFISDTEMAASKRQTPIQYRTIAAMMGTLGIGLDLLKYDEADRKKLKSWVNQYKSFRHIIHKGIFYRLSSAFRSDVAAYQYVLQDQSEAVVFIFGQIISFGNLNRHLRLKALEPEAVYSVKSIKKHTKTSRSGSSLMNIGIFTGMKGDFDSELLYLKKT